MKYTVPTPSQELTRTCHEAQPARWGQGCLPGILTPVENAQNVQMRLSMRQECFCGVQKGKKRFTQKLRQNQRMVSLHGAQTKLMLIDTNKGKMFADTICRKEHAEELYVRLINQHTLHSACRSTQVFLQEACSPP
eukprot:TRINITY_DN14719_c0_g1_i10.p1 TRINITY_DN14719_c0_g1~~TRINITY_DN14719_c0_g1_i10.p1  ORF type:complete len:136 (+),score=14.12 TRINITY_DN14719_c0_g1_i10:914-1321(+)